MALVHLNSGNYEQEVLKSDIPVIVDFWASWCAPCRMLGPIFEATSEEYKGKLKFAKLSTEEEQRIAAENGVMSIPTMIIFKDGKEVDRIVGAMPKEYLMSEIDKRLN